MSKRDKGAFQEHIAHDACGSSDGLAVYLHDDGTVDGHCWACGNWVPNPYGDNPQAILANKKFRVKTPQEIHSEIVFIHSQMPVRDLTDRGIRADIAGYFDVRAGVNQQDGISIAKHFYPCYNSAGEIIGYKIRIVDGKKFVAVSLSDEWQLFGEPQALTTGAKKLYITEGECDAMALYQALVDGSRGTEWEKYRPAVVSPMKGASGATLHLSARMDFLRRFQEIIIVFDQDDAGQKAVGEVMKLFGPNDPRVKVARLSGKDANDMLRAGKGEALRKQVLFGASSYKPSGILTVADLREKARKKPEMGMTWPWPSLTALTMGIRRGEMIGVGAGVGVGKTTFWHQLEEHLIFNLGKRVGVFMLEEAPAKTLKMISGKIKKTVFHDPTKPFDQALLDHALDILEERGILLYDHQEDLQWDSIKERIRHMVMVEGVRDIILDPISQMTFHLDSSRTNDELNRIFGELEAMVQALQFTLYYSSHLNPPDSGQPHEEGGRVKAMQFTGSRAMIKTSNYIIGIERNTQASDPVIKNTATLRVLKDREFGHTGHFPVYYDSETGSFLEPSVISPPTGVTY